MIVRRDDSVQAQAGAVDRHAEKRLKAAYADYETKRLPQLKQQWPTLKRSQLKQLLFKEWQKSPDNPINSRNITVAQVKAQSSSAGAMPTE